MPIFSAGSASVSVVPDFSGAQKAITEFFAAQKDVHVAVKPDLADGDVARTEAELNAMHGTAKVEVDKNLLSSSIATGIAEAMSRSGLDRLGGLLTAAIGPTVMTAIGGAFVELAAVASQAVGAIALVPAAMFAIAAPAAVAALGVSGMGAALKALDSGNAAKIAKAMADLAPAAQQVVLQIHALKPAFDAMQLDVQQRLFVGVGAAINNLAGVALPILRTGLDGIASAMNTGLLATMTALQGQGANFTTLFGNIANAIRVAAGAAAPLIQAFMTLAAVGSQFLPALAAGFVKVATAFNDWIQHIAATGQLVTIIQNAINVITELGRLAVNVGSVVAGIFTAALPGGALLLALLVKVTGGLATFAHSADGQTALRSFFDGITSAIGVVLPALSNLVQAVVTAVLPAIGQFAALLAPIAATLLNQLATALRAIGAILPPVATVMAALVSATAPLIPVISQMITTLLPPLVVVFGQLAPIINQVAQIIGQTLLAATKAIAPVLPLIGAAFIAILQALLPLIPAVLQLALQLLPPLLNVVKALVPIIQSAVTTFAAIAGVFLQIVGATVLPLVVSLLDSLATALRVLAPILGPLAGIILAIVAAAKAWAAIMVLVNIVLDANPIVLIGVAIAGLIVLIVEIVTHFQTFKDIVGAAIDWVVAHWQLLVLAIPGLGPVILAVVTIIQNFGAIWQAVVAGLKTAWDATSGALSTAWGAFWLGLQTAAQAVWSAITAAWSALTGALTAAWAATSGALSAAWGAFWGGLQTAAAAVWGALTAAWTAFTSGLAAAWTATSGAISAAWNAFWAALQAAAAAIWSALTAAWSAFTSGLATVWSAVSAALSAAWSAFWAAIQAAASAIWAALQAAWSAFTAAVRAVYDAFAAGLSAAWSAFWGAVQAAAAAVWAAIQAAWSAFTAAVRAIYDAWASALSAAWSAFWTAIQAAAAAIWAAIQAAWSAFTAAIRAVYDAFASALQAAWSAFWGAIQAAASAAWAALQAAWSAFTGALRAVYDAFASALSAAWGAFWGGLQSVAQGVWGAIQTAWSAAVGAVRTVFDSFASGLSGAWSALWNGLKTTADTIWGAIKTAVDAPIKFLVNTVLIGGLFTAWNAVADALGLGNLKITMAPITGFAAGGYTGETGLFGTTSPDDPAGVVHAREFVFTANQVDNAGGPDAMYALASQLDNGYAMGGLVRKNPGDPQPMLNSYVVPPDVAPRLSRFLDALSRGQAEAVQAAGGFDAIGPGFFWGGYADAVTAGKAFANTAVGKPYVWGGVGPNGYDCSGLQSAVTNVLRGSTVPYSRVGSTANFPWAGFSTGLGDYTIGSTPNFANSGVGHMASTLAGLNIESAGGVGVRTGSAAWGALHSGFSTQAFLANLGTANAPVAGASGGGQPSALTILGQVVSTAADVAALLGTSIASGVAHLAGMVSGNSNFEKLITAVPDKLRGMLWDKVKDQVGTLLGTLLGGTGTATPITGQGGSVADEAYLIAQSGFGWGTQADKDALNYIASHESGWNPTAQNPTSTASGIWQLIDSTWDAYRLAKDTSYAHARLAPSADQDWAGFGYIKARYGNPIAAQAYWAAHGNYDTGGWLPPGATGVINGTGGFEAVLNQAQQAAVVSAVNNPRGDDYHHVQVFLGDKEITDLIDMRVAHQSSRDGRTIRSSR